MMVLVKGEHYINVIVDGFINRGSTIYYLE